MLAATSAMPLVQAGAVAAPAAAVSSGPWTLSTTDPSSNYAPTFIGNGYLAARVPAEGTGFSTTPIATQSELAGFYANPPDQGFESRASLPTWTTLGLTGGGDSFGNLPVCVFNEQCEAVDGQLSGGAELASDHGGSTGGSFVAGLGLNGGPVHGASVTVPIAGSSAGASLVGIRYANGDSGSETVSVIVNGGAPQQITLPPTGSWNSWNTINVPAVLSVGTATVAVTVRPNDSGQVNIDTVAAYPASGAVPTVVAQTQQGTKSNYRQTLDMSTGTLTTSFTWTAPSGRATDFGYTVNADQSNGHVGMVTMAFTPHWSGSATIVDALDGRGQVHDSATSPAVNGSSGTLTENAVAQGTGVSAAIASVLRVNGSSVATATTPTAGAPAAQSASLTVQSGTTYTATKFVGIAASNDTDRTLTASTPQAYALSQATDAANLGTAGVTARNHQAWSKLWSADVSVPGDDTLTGQIRASMFYLLESTRAGVDWSSTPGGLSSDGYNGHVFWDMETWMYPALLAQHPDIAIGADAYRQRLLPAAESAAAALSLNGAKFPWESALTGNESIPPGNPEGTDEIHITADIALAQWQYYEATGDTSWLGATAWPVLRDAARYFASRAVPDPNKPGAYQIRNVMGPDEYHDNVNDDAYTNAAAQETLQIATRAAQITGNTADANWTTVAGGLGQDIPFDTADQRYLQYDGFATTTVKQADVTMMQYPWNVPMTATVAQNDLDYYAPITDINAPSMTDSINTIDSAALASSRCDSYTYLQRSSTPFIRAPFDQFSETRGGGAFTFTTGTGGFLQEFEYGFTGLRWDSSSVQLDPNLPPQLPGLDLTGLQWHGSTYNLSIRPGGATITVTAGPNLPVTIAGAPVQTVTSGSTLTVPTRTPSASTNLAQCKSVTASSADPSYPAAAAADGSPATAWHATSAGANLTVDLGTTTSFSQVQVVADGSTTAYSVQGSNDDSTWTTLGSQSATSAAATTVTFPAASFRYLRYQADPSATAQIKDLTVTAFGGGSGPITGYQGLCMDVRGGSSADGTPVQVYGCNSSPAQQWTLPGDGTVTALGKCLDVASGGTGNGTLVQLYSCNATGAQQWQSRSDGSLLNPQSGRCLDDTAFGGSGTQLEIWDCNGGPNQKWTLS